MCNLHPLSKLQLLEILFPFTGFDSKADWAGTLAISLEVINHLAFP